MSGKPVSQALCLVFVAFFLFGEERGDASNMSIDSLTGPVTQNEISSFISYMKNQTPPQTPWGTLGATNGQHNLWADGTAGRDLEAMGEMYEISRSLTILNQMISWADDCVSQRNDLMSTNNGGQREMWTGLIDEVWCPVEPSSTSAGYAGCENEDTEGHLAFCAKLILQTPSIWNTAVPDGDPHGYGTTYFQRATNYLARCDQANDEYSLKWFIQTGTSLIVAPTNAAWVAFNSNVNAINRQMMFLSGFQRLAEAHETLGDNAGRVAQYDAIVKAATTQCRNGMINYPGNPRTAKGQTVYQWHYYPTDTTGAETTEIHAEYDMIGIWRAFNRPGYGFTLAPLVPFANTMINVIYLGTNTFAGDVAGGSGTQSLIYSGWILPADWNPAVYTLIAGVAFTNRWYASSPDIDAGILFMKNRRYLMFSVAATPASRTVYAGTGTSFTVPVAPMGGFTNMVSLTVNGLPANTEVAFSSSSINPAMLNFTVTNVTLSISTSNATPPGSYALNIIGTGGGIFHTNTVMLVVNDYSVSASPSSLSVFPGASNVSYTVILATNIGFSRMVNLGVSGLPPDTSAGFSPSSLAGVGSSTLSVTTSTNTPPGNYSLTIAGTNGSAVATTTVNLLISSLPSPVTWTGGGAPGGNWDTAANWGGTAPHATGDNLVFSGRTQPVNTNNLVTAVGWIQLDTSTPFTIFGNALTLNSGFTNSTQNNTWSIPLSLGASQNFDVAAGTAVTNMAVISGSGMAITTTSPGTLVLTATNTYTGGTTINGGTVLQLNSQAGAGTGTIVDNGILALAQGGFKYANTISGSGIINVLPSANGTAGYATPNASMAGFNGTVNVGYAGVARFVSVTAQNLGGGTTVNVTTNGQFYLQTGFCGARVHVSGAGDGDGLGAIRLSGTNTGPVTLTDDNVAIYITTAGGISGPIGDDGLDYGFNMNASGTSATLTLNGTNTYGGATTISKGKLALGPAGTVSRSSNIIIGSGATLDASGRNDGTLTLAAGQILSGNGAITGNLTNVLRATVAPGAGLPGTLTVSGAVTLLGTTLMKVNKTTGTNDVLQVGSTLNYGGTLMMTNLSGTITSGDSFKLFSAVSYGGGFTNIVPALPGLNLGWNTNSLGTGVLRVLSVMTPSPKIGAPAWNGNSLIFSGTNGVPRWNYYVLTSTNLAWPVINWTCLATNSFDGNGNFSFTNSVQPNGGPQFYQIKILP